MRFVTLAPNERTEKEKVGIKWSGFPRWLQRHRKEDSPVGDLAVDALRDRGFPISGESLAPFLSHLRCNTHACYEAKEALCEAYLRYKRGRVSANDKSLIQDACPDLDISSYKVSRYPVSPNIRFKVFTRDKFTCVYCGRHSSKVPIEVDHKISLRDGGSGTMDNLVTACDACNRGKGAMSL